MPIMISFRLNQQIASTELVLGCCRHDEDGLIVVSDIEIYRILQSTSTEEDV